MGELVVRRTNDYFGRYRRLKVLVDGTRVGALKAEEQINISLPDGPHVIRAAMDWARSPDLAVTLTPARTTVEVRCPPQAMLTSFVRPRKAFIARLIARLIA